MFRRLGWEEAQSQYGHQRSNCYCDVPCTLLQANAHTGNDGRWGIRFPPAISLAVKHPQNVRAFVQRYLKSERPFLSNSLRALSMSDISTFFR